MMDHYAEIGKTQHSAVQRWLAPVLFGNWKCWNEDCKERVRDQLGPQSCSVHGPMVYDEYLLSYRGVTGHCDGILLASGDIAQPMVKELREVYDIIRLPYHTALPLEVKTRSSGDIQVRAAPDAVHFLQVNTYAYMIPHCIPILGEPSTHVLLHYVSRANHRVFVSFLRKVNPHAVDSLFDEIEGARLCVERKQLPLGICLKPSSDDATNCPLKGICFSPSLARELGVQEI